MKVKSFTAEQHKLYLPKVTKEQAQISWVAQQQISTHKRINDAPFPRMIDFWFTSIGYAVSHEIDPVEKLTGDFFVAIGPNKQDVQRFPEYWQFLLTMLAIDSWGYEDDRCISPSEVIALANRYAESGSALLLDELQRGVNMGSERLVLLGNLLSQRFSDLRDMMKDKAI
jgi:hypothetical protein